ncbi:AAA family ATPase [Actinoplanes sp. CA-030573]|uniref:AAA family ATPase n=1 Tax=Actinoplanes sp. CA-030573 TaxID=3239898 RepID=UPI003D8BBF2C
MRRILVYGVTGSGKSTLARRLGRRLALPYHSIDDLAWEPGWVPVREELQRDRVREICAGTEWVIDSAYGIWVDIPLGRADLIVGLDLPRWRSFGRLLRRTLVRLVTREPICNGNTESWRGTFLDRESLLLWHFKSFKRKRARMRLWAAHPDFPETVLLRSPREVERWLASLPDRTSGAGQA